MKEYGPTYAVQCPNCDKTQFWNLVHMRLWFTFFFIPIFPYESKYLMVCPICQQGIKLAGQQVRRAIELNKYSLAFLNKALEKEDYFAHLSQLDPLSIDGSGASRGMPVVQAPQHRGVAPPPMPRQKTVQLSFYDESGAVRNQVFAKAIVLLGSGRNCDLVLPALAPEHFRIFARGEGHYAEDLGGGLIINNREGSGEVWDNDILEAGSISFRLNID